MTPTIPHTTSLQSYNTRAETASHPLSAYLLRLMTVKKSNLCLSADVSSTSQLLTLACSLGPSIVLLKTHYDLSSNWDYSPTTGTGVKLRAIARKYGFLIFEDRKLGDIGSTVQRQYIGGTARICDWANICNVNMIPGKTVIRALKEAEAEWRSKGGGRWGVETEVFAGTPRAESEISDEDLFEQVEAEDVSQRQMGSRIQVSERTPSNRSGDGDGNLTAAETGGRKSSIVSITTVSQHFAPVNSPRLYDPKQLTEGEEDVFQGIEEAPMERGMLILAQMSSEGNFMTREYTDACVSAAREFPDFVMGFISQQTLNTEDGDGFLSMTPGCQLPPESDMEGLGEGEEVKVKGDGQGQQYNSPTKIIGGMGCDVIIVGRGIIKADDPTREAERYRKAAWDAYEKRLGAERV